MKITNLFFHCFICNIHDESNPKNNIHQDVLSKCLNLKQHESNFEKLNNIGDTTNLINNVEETSDQGIVPSDNFDDKVITKESGKKSTRRNNYLVINKKQILQHVESNNKKTVQEEKHFCSICNIQVCSCFKSHLTCRSHLMNCKSDYHYMMVYIEDKLLCEICQVYIPEHNESVKEHCMTEDHITKYKYILKLNKIEFNEKLKCLLCKVDIGLKHELDHIKKKKHRAMKKVNSSPLQNDCYCYICDTNVPNNNNELQKHLNEMTHIKKDEGRNETKLDFIKCKVCNIEVFNSVDGRAEHRRKVSHKIKYIKKLADGKVFLRQKKYYCFACTLFIDGLPLDHIEESSHRVYSNDLDTKMNSFWKIM